MSQPYRLDVCECDGSGWPCPACDAWRRRRRGTGVAYRSPGAEDEAPATPLGGGVCCPWCEMVFVPTFHQQACQAKGQQVFCGKPCARRYHDRATTARRPAARRALRAIDQESGHGGHV